MPTIISNYICFNFYTGWREIDQFYRQELGKDISPQITYVLQLCFQDSDISVKNLSLGMGLDPSATSNLLSRMDKKGLIKRTHDTHDRRVVNVRLTTAGKSLMDKLESKIKEIEIKIMKGTTEEEKNILKKIVGNIHNNRKNN